MHPYVYHDGTKYPFPLAALVIIAAVSIFLFWALNSAMENVAWFEKYRSYIQGPSVFVFFGVFYALFDSYLWKWSLLRIVGITSTPNLDGRWNSYILSSLSDYSERLYGTYYINQTFGKISVSFKIKISRSRSTWAVITPIDKKTVQLMFQYEARRDLAAPVELNDLERKGSDPNRWQDHQGTCRIFFHLDGLKVKPESGSYYTDWERQAQGDIHFVTEDADPASNNRENNNLRVAK